MDSLEALKVALVHPIGQTPFTIEAMLEQHPLADSVDDWILSTVFGNEDGVLFPGYIADEEVIIFAHLACNEFVDAHNRAIELSEDASS